VEAAFFLGDRTRLFLHIGRAKSLVVETSARREFRHGDQVDLTIDPRGSIEM
jgi:putative spermidine/putrescine transport system ATP-binding protein